MFFFRGSHCLLQPKHDYLFHQVIGEWSIPGILEYSARYYWRIVAWDTHSTSTIGPVWQFTTQAEENQPPQPPMISGPHYGKIATVYTFILGDLIDPEGDLLYVFWDWGDNTSGWLGPYETGQPVNASHSWSEPGNYTIRVKVKDINGAMSNWSVFWIQIIQLHTAGYFGVFQSINQTDDLFILHGKTFIVFPSSPIILNEEIIILSKRNLGYFGTTIAFGVGGITIL